MDREELVGSYQRYLTGHGIRSLEHYGNHLRYLVDWLARRDLSLAQVTPHVINEHLCFRKSLGHGRTTLRAALAGLRNFFRYARMEGLVRDDPTQGVSYFWLDVPGGLPAYQGPLRQIFRDPDAMLKYRLTVFGPFWEGYLQRLLDQRYSWGQIDGIMSHNYHFHRYLVGEGVRRFAGIKPRLVEAFLRRERIRFRQEHGRPIAAVYLGMIRNRIEGFLTYAFRQLHRDFRKPRAARSSRVLPARLVARYLEFCRVDGGLRPATRQCYLASLSRMGPFLDRRGIRGIQDVTLADLDAFLLRHSRHMGVRGLQAMASAVRSLFRFLHLDGQISCDLAQQVLVPRRFRADLRPKYLPWKKVRELLASVDRTQRTGKRDYAILVLLACHGLRAREAAGLRVEDIDFAGRSLLLQERKTGPPVRIPMSEKAAEALRDHLSAREDCAREELFLTAVAPLRPLTGRALSSVVQRRMHQCFGRLEQSIGAYSLRHSFAKALLDRGAKLHEIGALLRHKSLRSTLIYTRIATEDLREVADNYAQLLP
ncbi:MAG: tyrosine-type recombinase/integrase [Chloroflexota bacterium]